MKIYIEEFKELINSNTYSIKTLFEQNDTETINEEIRTVLSAEYLKTLGAFFTEQSLATEAIKQFQSAITAESIVLDPTCGIGSLLIESSRQLGVCSLLSDTLKQWNNVLRGFDIQSDFVELTKLRIVLEALHRGVKKDCSIEEAISYLSHIELRNALTLSKEELGNVTHLFMNPPFIAVQAPKRDYWGNGKTNAAAVFFDYYLRLLPKNSDVVVILPDVLRSGSRFSHFRTFVSNTLKGELQIWGRFSTSADVDVFILSGRKTDNNPNIKWSESSQSNKSILASKYNVCIGPLVAYRDKQQGNVYPYFHPKNCKTWEVITAVSETRAFSGKVIQPPCILIKRTSSPSDKFRAAATLIDVDQLIAVENHLIVVTPKDGTLKSCRKLLKILSKPKVNQFLNEQIRTRHLTVGVVKSIPLA
ncbi:Type I restriction-modification system methyltransferase subunit [uncultured Avibacterium sp.]|uniref:site-specific DNA-methyltransferase (adenine-specific) n=1 Tax=uncultured Avibacterium sp. TaxID=1936169 RepID=A0A486XC87_9PAST|nr:Type I restriction-modification system methyltransferase subunit [uncultured Avibacterium sp.]